MKPSTVAIVALVIAAGSALAFMIVGVHELDYASAHPGHFGPAKVIAWSALTGTALSFAVGLLAYVGIQLLAEGKAGE